jgi:hypothetical protein
MSRRYGYYPSIIVVGQDFAVDLTDVAESDYANIDG